MRQQAGHDLDVFKLARAAHAAPANAAEHRGIKANRLTCGVCLKLRAEGQGGTEAGDQKKNDENNDARCDRNGVATARYAQVCVDAEEHTEHHQTRAELKTRMRKATFPTQEQQCETTIPPRLRIL